MVSPNFCKKTTFFIKICIFSLTKTIILFIIDNEELFIQGENIMNIKSEAQYTTEVHKILDFFEKSYTKNLKFSDVMLISDIGENNFKKHFKLITGATVMHYFKKLKIEHAKELIENGKFNFTEISLILGILANSSSKKFVLTGRAPPCLYAVEIKHS